jgi:hypothetical protein
LYDAVERVDDVINSYPVKALYSKHAGHVCNACVYCTVKTLDSCLLVIDMPRAHVTCLLAVQVQMVQQSSTVPRKQHSRRTVGRTTAALAQVLYS